MGAATARKVLDGEGWKGLSVEVNFERIELILGVGLREVLRRLE